MSNDSIKNLLHYKELEPLAVLFGAVFANMERHTNGNAVLIPSEFDVEDISEYKESPDRVQENVAAHTLDGFLSYLSRFENDQTTIFVDPTRGRLKAVLDYHDPVEGTAHGDHVLTYTPSFSDAWTRWESVSGDLMDQQTFAEHIEEYAEDVIDPVGSKVLSIARNLEATKNVEFKSSREPDTGDVQLKYQEETDGSVGDSGEMDIPEYIKLGIPIFEGGPDYEVKARLRWRINNGRLRMGVKILRQDDLQSHAIEQYLEEVREAVDEALVHEVGIS